MEKITTLEKQITCGNKLDCDAIIKKTEPYIKIENRYFCCQDCVDAYIKQEARFERARDSWRRENIIRKHPNMLGRELGRVQN